jgi:hypothetical protein
VRLAAVAEVGERIGYEYDFGDSWEHELLVEARIEAEARQTYPSCIAGAGACPPEDSGGFPGYQRLKEVLADPSSEEHEEMRAWADSQTRGEFDPASFDLAKASARVSTARPTSAYGGRFESLAYPSGLPAIGFYGLRGGAGFAFWGRWVCLECPSRQRTLHTSATVFWPGVLAASAQQPPLGQRPASWLRCGGRPA